MNFNKWEETSYNITELKTFLKEEGVKCSFFKGEETETFREYHIYSKGYYMDTITLHKNKENKFVIMSSGAEDILSHMKLFG